MSEQTIRHTLTFIALAFASATIARAQSPALPANNSWQIAQSVGTPKKKLFIVTLDQPQRRQACRVQSFTADKLVCSRATGGPRTYMPQQVVALILPAEGDFKLTMLGLNAGLGASIWGTVVLTATCPLCAVATGIVAFLFFDLAGSEIFAGENESARLLYLAPGQQLNGKLRFIEPV